MLEDIERGSWQLISFSFKIIIILFIFFIGLAIGIFLSQRSFINSCNNIGVFKIGDKIYSCQNITPVSFSIILTKKGQK